MKYINFKKSDRYCYLVTYGNCQINMYARKVKDLYFVDIGGRYFEEPNFSKVKNKIKGLILSGNLKEYFFNV